MLILFAVLILLAVPSVAASVPHQQREPEQPGDSGAAGR
jgi:hypothetical protein